MKIPALARSCAQSNLTNQTLFYTQVGNYGFLYPNEKKPIVIDDVTWGQRMETQTSTKYTPYLILNGIYKNNILWRLNE